MGPVPLDLLVRLGLMDLLWCMLWFWEGWLGEIGIMVLLSCRSIGGARVIEFAALPCGMWERGSVRRIR